MTPVYDLGVCFITVYRAAKFNPSTLVSFMKPRSNITHSVSSTTLIIYCIKAVNNASYCGYLKQCGNSLHGIIEEQSVDVRKLN